MKKQCRTCSKRRDPKFFDTPLKDSVLVQTYYTTEQGRVYLHRKIGDKEWEKILTPYKEVPYIINTWITKEEVENL